MSMVKTPRGLIVAWAEIKASELMTRTGSVAVMIKTALVVHCSRLHMG
jgi:hypothetical protein